MLRFLQSLLERGITVYVSFRFWGVKALSNYRYFSDDEVKGLDKELCTKLDWARGRAGVPFRLTRTLDTPEHNEAVGGVQDSSHLRGFGADIACDNSQYRFKIVQALLLAGFNRVGVYDLHCHVDNDPSLPQNVMWIGTSH